MFLGHKEVIQGEENVKNGVTDGQVPEIIESRGEVDFYSGGEGPQVK